MSVIAISVHPERKEAGELAAEAARHLLECGNQVWMDAAAAEALGMHDLGRQDWGALERLDLALSIGGDGTMLRTVQKFAATGAPVLGINAGSLGYLSEVEPEGMLPALDGFLSGSYEIEERLLITAELEGSPGYGQFLAMNEVVVEKAPQGHTVRIGVSFDERSFATYAADGMIVATPTGSTGYSLSARGPIVDPLHRALIVTPVAPHMLFDRSLVLDPDKRVRLDLLGDKPAVLAVDGNIVAELDPGASLLVRAADTPARLVTFGGLDFHQRLKEKFGLSDR